MATAGEQGEDSGGNEDLQLVLTPISPPPRNPTKPPAKERKDRYEQSSGGVSTSVSMPAGRMTFVDGSWVFVFDPIPKKEYLLNPGWNTRASIPEPIGPTMYLSYKSGAAVGAVVGLTTTPEKVAGYDDIILGWMTLQGVAHIISYGEVLYEVPTASTVPELGAYNRDVDALTIRKTLNKVEFFLTSEEGQEGETKIGEAFMSEPVTYVSAALYLGGDTINDEILEYPDVVAGELPAMRSGFYESDSASYLMGTLPAITSYIYEADNSQLAATIPAMTGFFGDFDSAVLLGSLPAVAGNFISASDDILVPDFNYFFADLPLMTSAFIGRDVTFGTLDAEMPAAAGFFADEDLSLIRSTLPALQGGFYEQEFPDRFTFVNFMYAAGRMLSRPTHYIVLNSRAEVVAAFTISEIQHMLIESGVTAGDTATLTSIIYQVLASTMSASDVAALQNDGMSVWALHMDSMGSTRYEGYDFNSFMTIDGQTYGVNATGIHRLEGSTDDGAAIPASVDFGSLSFGTNSRKALPYVYVGMSSTGKTVLKVESDGQTYYYTARDSTELMKSHRFELGRGLRSTFYGLSLTTDGEAFDLHNIDFQPVELKRSL